MIVLNMGFLHKILVQRTDELSNVIFIMMTGGTATVFQRVGYEFLRTPTWLKREGDSRVFGTLLGTDSDAPSYKTEVQLLGGKVKQTIKALYWLLSDISQYYACPEYGGGLRFPGCQRVQQRDKHPRQETDQVAEEIILSASRIRDVVNLTASGSTTKCLPPPPSCNRCSNSGNS